jgi:hypothetical protein
LTSPHFWFMVIITVAIVHPWLVIRKVRIAKAWTLDGFGSIRLHFDYTTPNPGTTIRLAKRPLCDHHGFATITNLTGGYSIIVSGAGDFTNGIIAEPPRHIWVSGIPTYGVLGIVPLFHSVLLVATGSGIGPCLSIIIARQVPCHVLWITSNPEKASVLNLKASLMKGCLPTDTGKSSEPVDDRFGTACYSS